MGDETITLDGKEYDIIKRSCGAIVARRADHVVITSGAVANSDGKQYVSTSSESVMDNMIDGLQKAKYER